MVLIPIFAGKGYNWPVRWPKNSACVLIPIFAGKGYNDADSGDSEAEDVLIPIFAGKGYNELTPTSGKTISLNPYIRRERLQRAALSLSS